MLCCHAPDADSEEMEPQTKNKVIIFMPEGSKTHLGGTMRCGLRKTVFDDPDCMSAKLYGTNTYAYAVLSMVVFATCVDDIFLRA